MGSGTHRGFESRAIRLEVFTFQPSPCSRLDLVPPRGCRGLGQGRCTSRFRGDVLRNCVRSLPACGLAALNPWAGPKQGRIRAMSADPEYRCR
jgi:hypothetical protein